MLKIKFINLELSKKEIFKGIFIFLLFYFTLGFLFATVYLGLFILNKRFVKIKFNSNKVLNRNH